MAIAVTRPAVTYWAPSPKKFKTAGYVALLGPINCQVPVECAPALSDAHAFCAASVASEDTSAAGYARRRAASTPGEESAPRTSFAPMAASAFFPALIASGLPFFDTIASARAFNDRDSPDCCTATRPTAAAANTSATAPATASRINLPLFMTLLLWKD